MKSIRFITCFATITLLFNFNAKSQRLTFSSELGYFIQDDNVSTIGKCGKAISMQLMQMQTHLAYG